MILIIQNGDTNTSFSIPEKFLVFKKICDVKTYGKEPYTIVLVDINVNDEGVVEKYNFMFEELIISLDVVTVITNKQSFKLQEICNYYKIPLLELKY